VSRSAIRTIRGAYLALVAVVLIWGSTWVAMKLGLRHADPVIYNIQRTVVGIGVLFGVLLLLRRPLSPASWVAVAVTGFFQTTINFGATAMALAEGGIGRTAVLTYTMPFWTVLFAWPVLHERLRGLQWLALVLALGGLALIVEPWNWHDVPASKWWAAFSGLGWAGGTISIKYFQRRGQVDPLNLMAWQLTLGVLPLLAIALARTNAPTEWSAVYVALLLYVGGITVGVGFALWTVVLHRVPAGTASLATLSVPVIALLTSMAVFDERLGVGEWAGITCIGSGLAVLTASAWRASRRDAHAADEPPRIEGG